MKNLRNPRDSRDFSAVFGPEYASLNPKMGKIAGELGVISCDGPDYRDDPLVQRVCNMKRIPDASTLSRILKDATPESVEKLKALLGEMVIERLVELALPRITLDFDGSVLSTRRKAEQAAVGFNKKKKGARSYYPLFCTVAQTSQVFSFLPRSGNVHDSNGAQQFIKHCIDRVRRALPGVTIEVRMDSAFFSDEIVSMLTQEGIEFSISVPFERFPHLKTRVESREVWYSVNSEQDYFEMDWCPECWHTAIASKTP